MNTIFGNKQGAANSIKNNVFKPELGEYPAFPFRYKYLLLLLPVIFCLLWLYCYYHSRTFYCTYPDSIYIYLINATNIAGGNTGIGHYDNPGTPVHLLGGLIVYIVHLFAGKGKVYEDVLADPEFYLRFCAGTFALMLFSAVYFAGRLILKHTGNVVFALTFQLLPLCAFFTIHYLLLVRMCPENLLIPVLIFYYAFLWVLSYKRDHYPQSAFSRKSYLFLFSFVSALLVTTKMTCLPFLILPLFFIDKFSHKTIYAVLTFFIGALLIYPIWPYLPEMYTWFTHLATHSGDYGQGQAGVSVSELLSNLGKLLLYDLFFSAGFLLLTITVILGFIRKLRRQYLYRLVFVFWLICCAQLLLACKQFGYHYLIASNLSIIPGIAAAYRLFAGMAPRRQLSMAAFAACLFLFSFNTFKSMGPYREENKMYLSGLESKKYNDLPKIITSGYQGAGFVESALRFGASFGGWYYYSSNYFLRSHFPHSYFYDMQRPDDFIKQWDVMTDRYPFFMDKPQTLVYFVGMDEKAEQQVLQKITNGLGPVLKDVRLLEYKPETRERFYRIEVDTAKANPHYTSATVLNYDFEALSADRQAFLSGDGKSTIGAAGSQTGDKAFAGKHALKISENEYSCCTTFDVAPGDELEISVNSFAPLRPVGIAVSAPEPGRFDRNSEATLQDYGNGWKKIGLKVFVPIDFSDTQLKFCLFYFGKKTAYADDLHIVIRKGGKIAGEQMPQGLTGGQKFIIKAGNGKYVTLNPQGVPAADQPDSLKAEVFEVTDLGNGNMALKAGNGKFLCEERDQKKLAADRDKASLWETFHIRGESLSAVSIKSSLGMFVRAEENTGRLVADQQKTGMDALFRLVKK